MIIPKDETHDTVLCRFVIYQKSPFTIYNMKSEYRINNGNKVIYYLLSAEIIGLTMVYLIPSTFYFLISLNFTIGILSLITAIIGYLKLWILKKNYKA